MGNLLDGLVVLRTPQQLFWEVLHRHHGSVEQMAGPGDAARDGREIAHDGWRVPVLLVLLFDLEDEGAVLGEQQLVLVVEGSVQVVAMQDAPELSEEPQAIFNVDDDIKVLVDVSGEGILDFGHLDVELDEVSVEDIDGVVKEFMVFPLELDDALIEVVDDGIDVFQVVLLEGVELADRFEKFDQFTNSSAEQLEFAEDLVGREVELFGLWHSLETLLGEIVLLDVSVFQVLALLKHGDEFVRRVLSIVPQVAVVDHHLLAWLRVHGSLGVLTQLDAAEIDDVVLAIEDHLVGDLLEEARHALVGVVVSSDGMDHLNRVHQGGQGLLDAGWSAVVEGLDELLQGLQVLHVVLRLTEGFSDLQLDGPPL